MTEIVIIVLLSVFVLLSAVELYKKNIIVDRNYKIHLDQIDKLEVRNKFLKLELDSYDRSIRRHLELKSPALLLTPENGVQLVSRDFVQEAQKQIDKKKCSDPTNKPD